MVGIKAILSNDSLYKEFKIEAGKQYLKIGTETGCDIRLNKELFKQPVIFSLYCENQKWFLNCEGRLCVKNAHEKDGKTCGLFHGSKVELGIEGEEEYLFTLDFMLDFESNFQRYEYEIDINGRSRISIGNRTGNDIVLISEYAKGDNVVLEKTDIGLKIKILQTVYGICKNGKSVMDGEMILPTDFFSIADCGFYYNHGRLYTTDLKLLQMNGLSSRTAGNSINSLVYPVFNRSTHPEIHLPDEDIPILEPASKPEKPEANLIVSLLPSLTMLVLVVLLRGVMSGSSNLAYILFSVCSMAIGIVTSIITFFRGKKKYTLQVEKREQTYHNYILHKEKEIQTARKYEIDLRNESFPDEYQNLKMVRDFSGNLYDRSKNSEKFLKIRIGKGTDNAVRKISYQKKETIIPEEELESLPAKLSNAYQQVEDIPITIDLKKAFNIGIVGNLSNQYDIMKVIILDLCVHHYSKEVQLFFVMSPDKISQYRWIRLLPHVYNDSIDERNIVFDATSKASRLEYLYKEICWRESVGADGPYPWIVVFLLDDMGFYKHPVSKFLENAHDYHVHFISFVDAQERLPMYCGQIIRLLNDGNAELIETNGNIHKSFVYPLIKDQDMRHFAQKLAPVHCQDITLEDSLKKNITFFELIKIYSIEDLDIKKRWESCDITRTMAAPIGIKGKNDIVYLDLHEQAHGPHGLVAGTTGSGKSELLQTYILAMALQYSPIEVGFVLIDFKGGGMANQFQNLPHLVGSITDIDGQQIQRSLLSIRAEIDKRKSMFANADVNNISDYIKGYRNGKIKEPLPHLIIIVDEFAELKAEQPEFMKELISASRIGRSLGIHLILATQKPAGQVSDQIWSNSRFRLCLKVQNQADSNEVLHSPLAAEIKEPGRAYFQVGNNEIFELFQSAYSGAMEKDFSDEIHNRTFHISQVDFAGRRTVVFEQKNNHDESEGRNQLHAVVDFLKFYCESNHSRKMPAICLPPLPEMLAFPNVDHTASKAGLEVEIGLYDAPEQQYQGAFNLNLAGENTFILGSSQYGKTNLLQCIIRMLASCYTPEDVNIYILDFGSMFLKNYEKLPHIGGVVTASEDEKYRNLFKMLNEQIVERRDKLIAAGVSSFHAYREAGFMDLPYIVIMIDNFTALKESYLEDEDLLLPICREGSAVGISVVVTNAVTNGFGYKYFSTISHHISFHCNEEGEIHNLFGFCTEKPGKNPGSCLIEKEKKIYNAQIYLAFTGEKEIDRTNAIRQFINEMNIQYKDRKACPIPAVPENLSISDTYRLKGASSKKDAMVIGVGYENIEPIALHFRNQFMLAMIGDNQESKMEFVKAVFSDIKQNFFERKLNLYIVDGTSKEFKDYKDLPFVKAYSSQADSLMEMVANVHEILVQRNELVENEGVAVLEQEPMLMVIVNNKKAIEMFGNSRNDMQLYDDIADNYRNLKVLFIFTAVENMSSIFNAGDLMKRIRDEQKAIIFDALKNVRLYDISLSDARSKDYPLGKRDAFYMDKDVIERVKLYTL